MDSANDEPGYSLETSYYGPGALAWWYLTFASLLMTWMFHPTARFKNREVTFDLVAFQIYPCFAAGHLVHQVNAFDPGSIGDLVLFLWKVGSFNSGKPENLTEDGQRLNALDPLVKKALVGFNSPFRVCVVSASISGISLVALLWRTGLKGEPGRRRGRKLMPWILFFPWLWIVGCLVYMAARLQHGMLGVAAAVAAIAAVVLLAEVMFVLFLCGCCFGLWTLVKGAPEYIGELRDWPRECDGLSLLSIVILSVGSFAVPTGLLFVTAACGFIVWVMVILWLQPLYFPLVGVGIGALDQLFGLVTGALLLPFNAYHIFVKPKGWRAVLASWGLVKISDNGRKEHGEGYDMVPVEQVA